MKYLKYEIHHVLVIIRKTADWKTIDERTSMPPPEWTHSGFIWSSQGISLCWMVFSVCFVQYYEFIGYMDSSETCVFVALLYLHHMRGDKVIESADHLTFF